MPSSVIKPSRPIVGVAKQRRAIVAALDDTAKDVQADFQKTTASWEHDVEFAIKKAGEFTREISTGDSIYNMLNEGTPEHLILPRSAKMLRFNVPFQSKTVPRSISSGPGSIGAQTVYSRGVVHPGTDAREWDSTIAEKYQEEFPRRMQREIDGALT